LLFLLPRTVDENELQVSINRLAVILELLPNKSNVTGDLELIPIAFETLALLLNLNAGASVPLEYVKQLTLSYLLALMNEARASQVAVDESVVRVDLLVQCIRISDNPQTHNHALLLMAAIALMYPEKVLQNCMPVFTFMGASVLRQDDNYSFHVIKQVW
jgi:hypothetical protein